MEHTLRFALSLALLCNACRWRWRLFAAAVYLVATFRVRLAASSNAFSPRAYEKAPLQRFTSLLLVKRKVHVDVDAVSRMLSGNSFLAAMVQSGIAS